MTNELGETKESAEGEIRRESVEEGKCGEEDYPY